MAPMCAVCWDMCRFQHLCLCTATFEPVMPRLTLKEYRRACVFAALKAASGNRAEAARILKISRSTIDSIRGRKAA